MRRVVPSGFGRRFVTGDDLGNAWRPALDAPSAETAAPPTRRRSSPHGLLVGLGNPKMVSFFVAFIGPARGSAVTQMLVLGSGFRVIFGLAAWIAATGHRTQP